MSTSSIDDYPEGMGRVVYQQILDLWVEPELKRRGSPIDPQAIPQALVVMQPDTEVEVHIGGEARIIADFAAKRPLKEGEAVTFDDVEELRGIRPDSIDGNAGWVLFVQVGTSVYVAFDFRRNKAKARRLLDSARHFADTAEYAASKGMPESALVNAYCAVELAVKAQMLVMSHVVKKSSHPGRQRWLANWASLGNVPRSHSSTLGRLAQLQSAARYGDAEIDVSSSELEGLLTGVSDVISLASGTVAG
jgi:hypothetical protein